MFVDWLNIEEFRGIKKCSKNIEFSNFTVLIGKNNSGKSAILDALSLLPDLDVIDYITRQTKIQYISGLHPGGRESLHYLYAGPINLSYGIQSVEATIIINENNSTTTYINGKEQLFRNLFSSAYPKEDLLNFVLFIPYSKSLLVDLELRMQNLEKVIMKEGIHKTLANFLNKCVNDQYSEFVFLRPISLRRVYPENQVYINLSDQGSGAEKIIKIIAIVEVLSPKLLIIDDFEAGLHPTMIKLFFEWLKTKKIQTVISTHSIDVLYHLVDIEPDDTTILQLSKSNEDILSSTKLTLKEVEALLNTNNDPRLLGNLFNL